MTSPREAAGLTSPRQAAARALARLPSDHTGAVVVSGRDPGLAAGFVDAAPARAILAPSPASRLAVAAGAAMAGRPTLAVLDQVHGVAAGPWDLGGPLVVLTDALAVAGAAHRAGTRVFQPAWATDVEPLLRAALARARPCCLFVHSGNSGDRPAGVEAPQTRRPRVLAEGETATVVTSGRLAAPVAAAAVSLAKRGVAVTVLELAALPAAGFPPEDADAGLLIGGPPRGAGHPLHGRSDLRWVAAPAAGADAVADVLLGALRATARPGPVDQQE